MYRCRYTANHIAVFTQIHIHGKHKPEKDKALKVYESDHWVPINEMVRETLGWLEKYFGPVNQ